MGGERELKRKWKIRRRRRRKYWLWKPLWGRGKKIKTKNKKQDRKSGNKELGRKRKLETANEEAKKK